MALMPVLQTPPTAKAQPKHSAFDAHSPMHTVSAKKGKALHTPCAFPPACGWLQHIFKAGSSLGHAGEQAPCTWKEKSHCIRTRQEATAAPHLNVPPAQGGTRAIGPLCSA